MTLESFTPIGDPRQIGDLVEIQYVGDKSHSHEGGHRIAIAGREVICLPDGHTTARQRSHAITAALSAADSGGVLLDLGIDALVGALVRAGATNIIIDGEPLFDRSEQVLAAMRLDVTADGTIRVASIGGAA